MIGDNWPADKVERVSVKSLVPYANNARTHTDEQIAQIMSSIREWGFTTPILRDETGMVIAGHGRLIAAMRLELDEVPVVTATWWTESQKRAYVIADNRLALSAGWDDDLLSVEIGDLDEAGFDLDLLGFDDGEIDDLLAGEDDADAGADTEPQEDRAEELREKWGVETGQLWQLGEHRLLCGDSTKADDVALVMGGEEAGICFTSPPYGQQRDYRDGGAVTDWEDLMQRVFVNLPMADDGQVLVNLGLIHKDNEWIPYWDNWIEWMRNQGWRRFGWYVWNQGAGMMGDFNGRLAPCFEFVFHFNKIAKRPEKWVDKKEESIIVNKGGGMRNKKGVVEKRSNPDASLQATKIPDSVICVNRVAGSNVDHPAMFPVLLAEFINKSWPGICFEPFSGSGTTIIACENLKRKCRAIEISPAYIAVAIQRWADHTGGEPKLLQDGVN